MVCKLNISNNYLIRSPCIRESSMFSPNSNTNLLTTLLRVSFSIKTPMATFKTYKLIFLDQVFSHYFNKFLVGTPYENGVFRCKIVLTDNFPANPPKGYFLTKIFHPNVAQPSGDICVNTLKKDWNP